MRNPGEHVAARILAQTNFKPRKDVLESKLLVNEMTITLVAESGPLRMTEFEVNN